MDVKTITLSAEQQKAFDKFKNSNSACLTKEEFALLRKDKLLEPTMDGKSDWYSELPAAGECHLSDAGKRLRAYQASIAKAERKSTHRFTITTGIAIAALLNSIAAEILCKFFR